MQLISIYSYISLSSILQHGGPMYPVYSGTKAFVRAFSESVAAEVDRDGIDVVAG